MKIIWSIFVVAGMTGLILGWTMQRQKTVTNQLSYLGGMVVRQTNKQSFHRGKII